jgi:hypothetical protein
MAWLLPLCLQVAILLQVLFMLGDFEYCTLLALEAT